MNFRAARHPPRASKQRFYPGTYKFYCARQGQPLTELQGVVQSSPMFIGPNVPVLDVSVDVVPADDATYSPVAGKDARLFAELRRRQPPLSLPAARL